MQHFAMRFFFRNYSAVMFIGTRQHCPINNFKLIKLCNGAARNHDMRELCKPVNSSISLRCASMMAFRPSAMRIDGGYPNTRNACADASSELCAASDDVTK
mmetsp:Transcript_2638/g.7205  ORF Transcript_2638/g.7205 Transcript_2638/m.7205 type:complete len:101 (-) Transcript_2638:1724-2026(-)